MKTVRKNPTGLPIVVFLVLVLASLLSLPLGSAFVGSRRTFRRAQIIDAPASLDLSRHVDTSLASTVNQIDKEEFRLPPKPEDLFVLTGDLLSLSVYGFLDHFVCRDLANVAVNGLSSPDQMSAAVAAAELSTNPGWSVPVWWDDGTFYSAHVLHVTLQDRLVTSYSPLLQPVGLAVTLLASCWIFAGWWHQAFSVGNTQGSPRRALRVTAVTWCTCTALMVAVVGASHGYSYFTKGDVDYIFDSLIVLMMWRFLASWLLGSGKDD